MNFAAMVFTQVDRWIEEIEAMDIESLARATGFQQRSQRKVGIRDLAVGILAVASAGRLSFERVANSIGRRSRKRYSKQALHKRLGPTVSAFLLAVFGRCMQPAIREPLARGLFASFKRVLLHDSSVIALPSHFATHFPGSANRHNSYAQLKIQVVCDLLTARVEQLSLSGFARNDQRAAPDILQILKAGDLVIRDLGYFVFAVFAAIIERGAFFLSRYRYGTVVLDPRTQRPIPLTKVLKKQGFFDANVLLGVKDRIPVRLVAVAVSDAVANHRRRKLRQNRDLSLNPGKEHFYLLGWNLFLTNVPPQLWPAKQLPVIDRLRWRIETLFKAWKSHLALTDLSDRCLAMIHLSIMTKLIFCAFVCRTCHHIEIVHGRVDRHVSILRIAKILSAVSLCLEAAFVKLTPQQLLAQLLDKHAFYEPRHDRPHFQDHMLAAMSLG